MHIHYKAALTAGISSGLFRKVGLTGLAPRSHRWLLRPGRPPRWGRLPTSLILRLAHPPLPLLLLLTMSPFNGPAGWNPMGLDRMTSAVPFAAATSAVAGFNPICDSAYHHDVGRVHRGSWLKRDFPEGSFSWRQGGTPHPASSGRSSRYFSIWARHQTAGALAS